MLQRANQGRHETDHCGKGQQGDKGHQRRIDAFRRVHLKALKPLAVGEIWRTGEFGVWCHGMKQWKCGFEATKLVK